MKIKTRKIYNLWRETLNWLRLAVKLAWRKFVSAGKRFEPLPDEAPH